MTQVRGARRGVPVLVLVLAHLLAPASAAVASGSAGSAAVRPTGAGPAGQVPSGTGFRAPVPLPLTVLNTFSAPQNRYAPGHRGVDLAVPAGAPVRAAADGKVVFAGRVAGRPVVSVEHAGGLRTTYEPVEPAVAAGARVAAGEVLGTLIAGHPGCPGLDCLHWGARLPDRVYLDPLLLLGAWPVRLWPWTDP